MNKKKSKKGAKKGTAKKYLQGGSAYALPTSMAATTGNLMGLGDEKELSAKLASASNSLNALGDITKANEEMKMLQEEEASKKNLTNSVNNLSQAAARGLKPAWEAGKAAFQMANSPTPALMSKASELVGSGVGFDQGLFELGQYAKAMPAPTVADKVGAVGKGVQAGVNKLGPTAGGALLGLAGSGIRHLSNDKDATTMNFGESTGRLMQGAGAGLGLAGMIGASAAALPLALVGAAGYGIHGLVQRNKARVQERNEQEEEDRARAMLSRAYTDAFNDNMMMSGTDLGFNVTNAPTNSYTPSQQIMYQKNGGLWANIHAKRKRIKEGSGEKMRKPGSKGAPTDEALKRSQMKMGGMKVPGGTIQPLPGGAVEFVGKKHNQGGIMLDPQTEVEGGETMDKVMINGGGPSDYIFSDYLKLGGITFATRHKNMLKAGASQQDIQQLAKMQEQVAAKEGANENGPRSPQRIAKLGGVRKYQEAGEYRDPDAPQVNIPTFGVFPPNYFDLGASRLDYQVAEELARRKGGNAAMYLAGADTIAHHESGPLERMATNAWQGGSETLPGKGTFQIEGSQYGGSNTLETAQNHLARTMGYWGESIPPRIANATDASTLSYEDQRALALAHLLQGPVPMADYASGNIDIGDVWARGWKKTGANLNSFENSRVDAQTNGIPRTNYVERENKTGGVRKYQEGDVVRPHPFSFGEWLDLKRTTDRVMDNIEPSEKERAISNIQENNPRAWADIVGAEFNYNWNNSPMANKMLTDSYNSTFLSPFAEDLARNITQNRNENISETGYVPTDWKDSKLKTSLFGDEYVSGMFYTNGIRYNPSIVLNRALENDPDLLQSVAVHERSHSADFGTLFMNNIPYADRDLMNSLLRPEEERFPENSNEDHEEFINYLQKPTEVRARLMQLRHALQQNGVDIFNSPVTEEQLNRYPVTSLRAFKHLNEIYDQSAILKLLNSIAYKDNGSLDANMAKNGGIRKYQEGNIYTGQRDFDWQHQARTNPYIDFTGLRVGDPGSAAAAMGTPFMEQWGQDLSGMSDADFKEWYDKIHIPTITEAFNANRDKVIEDAKAAAEFADSTGNSENFNLKIRDASGNFLSDAEIFEEALRQTTDGKIGSWHVAPWSTEEGDGGEEEDGEEGGGNTGGGEEYTEKETPGCPCKDGTTRPECCKDEYRNLWPLAGLATLAGLAVPKGNYKAARLTQPVTTRQANLPRVNYNAARAESANMNTAARRFAGNQLSGPAGAAYAAMSDQNARAQSLKISDAEAKQNKDLMDREATLNAGIRAKNAAEINATSKANADRMQRTDEFRFEQDLINRKYKADTISQTAKDIMQYRSDERLARATDDTGSYMRFLMENPDIFRRLVGAPPTPAAKETTTAKNGGYISKLNKVKKRK